MSSSGMGLSMGPLYSRIVSWRRQVFLELPADLAERFLEGRNECSEGDATLYHYSIALVQVRQ